MGELHPVHRYAAGALLALALHQAQIHQQSLPSHADMCRPESQGDLAIADYDEKDTSLWTGHRSGLLRPIFRYLKIDPKAWPGLELTALSTDAESHIRAFLKILSEEEEDISSCSNAEDELAKAVDTVALTFEEDVALADNKQNPTQRLQLGKDFETASLELELRASENARVCLPISPEASTSSFPTKNGRIEGIDGPESFGVTEKVENVHVEIHKSSNSCGLSEITSSTSALGGNLEEAKIQCRPTHSSGGMSVLREDYFSTQSENKTSSPGSSSIWKDFETTVDAREDFGMKKLGEAPMDRPEDKETLESYFLKDNAIWEARSITQQRKVAVLYELLCAFVADIPPENGEDVSRLRRGYDARQRVAIRLLSTWLDVKWTKVAATEVMVAYSSMAAQEEKEENGDDKQGRAKTWAKWKRGGLIGAAALTGGALLAVTGGLAAPAIAAGLTALAPTLGTIIPVIGSTGFAAAAAAAGTTVGSVAVGASFGAAGASLTGYKMARRTGGVEEFGFEGIGENHQQGCLAVGIVVSGFVNEPEDFTKPWRGQDGDLERYALRWETKNLIAISTAIQDWLTASITKELMKQGAMLTVLSTLLTALAWPSALLTLTDFIDSKWVVAVDRSDKAGKLLAEVLLKGLQGNRPVTLIGFSLGARVIFKCLEKLAKKGENGRIVERVILLGAPISLETQRWETVRKVVAGRFVNAYATNDWLLAVIYRASLMSQGLAGIQAVNVPGIENVEVTDMIKGHSSYLENVGDILRAIEIDCYFPKYPSKIIISSTLEDSQSM